MRDAYPFLQNLKAANHQGDKCYLLDTYDVYGYFPVFTETNPLAMIRNTIYEAFNAHLKMPNAIVIVAGTDLLTQDKLFLPSELEKKLRWILKEITIAVTTRKSDLKPKNFTFGEPRIIWIKSFKTTESHVIPNENILKFNNLLRRTCASKSFLCSRIRTLHHNFNLVVKPIW